MNQPCVGHLLKVPIGRAHGQVHSSSTQGQSEEIGHARCCRRIGNHGLQDSGFSVKDESRSRIDSGRIMSGRADDDVSREQGHGFSEAVTFLGFRGFQRSQEFAGIRIEIHDAGVRLCGPSSQGTDDQQFRITGQRPSEILLRLRIRRFKDTLHAPAFSIEEKHLSMINRIRAAKRGTHRKNGAQKRHRMTEPIRTAVSRTWRGKGPADFPGGDVNQIGFPDLEFRGGTRPGISNSQQQILCGHGMPKRCCPLIGTGDHLS